MNEAGLYRASDEHDTCGVGFVGRIRCWGSNSFGELAIGRSRGAQWSPVEIVAQE